MRWLISAVCSLVLGIGVLLVCAQLARAADKELQGTWTATKAERDGRAATDLVGHRLFFSGNRFEIQSKDRKSLYSGTVQVDASAKPAAIDFQHAEGGLKGKTWKGIYVLDSETLTVCDNAENLDAARPSKFGSLAANNPATSAAKIATNRRSSLCA